MALDLLDTLRSEQLPGCTVVAGPSYGGSREFRQGLAERSMVSLSEVPEEFVSSLHPPIQPVKPLNLFRFAPTSHGTEAIDSLLIDRTGTATHYAVGRLGYLDDASALRLWQSRLVAMATVQRLKNGLGLDHFEGRSWRGFHHHACLVALAHAFWLLEPSSICDQEKWLARDLACSS